MFNTLTVSLLKIYRGKKKEQLWQHVEHLMSQHSPQKVVQALTLLTEDTALVLRNKTATIDIRKDAEELRFTTLLGLSQILADPYFFHTLLSSTFGTITCFASP